MKKLTKDEINGRSILLLDYDYDEDPEFKKVFQDLFFIKLKQSEIEIQLTEMIKNRSFKPETTLFVCVGQSGLELCCRLTKKLNFSIPKISYVHAQRVYEDITLPGGRKSYNVGATVGQIQVNEYLALNSTHKFLRPKKRYDFKNTEIKKIVILDDVISTGITLKTLFDRNHFLFPKASWEAFVLISRLERIKNYISISAPYLVDSKFTPLNTFSKLVEDKIMAIEYISKHLPNPKIQSTAKKIIDCFYQKCFFTPHVFCFDLYNTLAIEECDKSYIDYFTEQYGEKYNFTKEDVYFFVRDNLMNRKYATFGEMTLQLFHYFVPSEKCFPYNFFTPANYVRKYWEQGSQNVKWINYQIVEKIKELQSLGHVVGLITNCTLPAWHMVKENLQINIPGNQDSIYFDFTCVSSEVGFSKPNEDIWKNIEKEFSGFPRNKFVMIGDNFEDDLVIPQKRGWQIYDENFLHQFVL